MPADLPPLLLTILAGLPVLAVLILMLALRWPAARAGAAGLVLALGLAYAAFEWGSSQPSPALRPALFALVEALFLAFTIWWVILPALFIFHLQEESGAIAVLRGNLARISSRPEIQLILIAWFFALFMEGAAGFGTPVALAAPLLAGLGFAPLTAVSSVILCYVVGVCFGAVGIPFVPLAEASGLSGETLAPAVAGLHVLTGWPAVYIALRFFQRSLPADERRPVSFGWPLLAAALFLIPYFAIAYWIGPELPPFGGALLGGALFIWIYLKKNGRQSDEARLDPFKLLAAASPYLILILLVASTRLVPPLQAGLSGAAWEWSLPGGYGGRFQPLYHPGTLLLAAAAIGARFQKIDRASIGRAAGDTARRIVPVTLALVMMLSLARVMVHSGMIAQLAGAAAAGTGPLYPLFAPLVGVLGSFITGSSTASNILFGEFQAAAAGTLNLPLLPLMGAQGYGSAIGNMISPQVIIAGCATVGMSGKEGEIIRRTLVPCLLYALAGGLLTLLFATWSQ